LEILSELPVGVKVEYIDNARTKSGMKYEMNLLYLPRSQSAFSGISGYSAEQFPKKVSEESGE